MQVLVCGGRNYGDRRSVYECLDGLVPRPTLLITGGANGADMLAADWAGYRQVPKLIFRADWERHGRAAGPIRNQQMLECKPDLVVAFAGGRGTADMVRRAKAAGIHVMEI
jgi:hypothetical protein